MTSLLLAFLQTITVRTAADLLPYWDALVGDGGFRQRTLWVGVLDEDAHPTPVVVPIDDVPPVPGHLGTDGLRSVLTSVAEFGTPVLLVARPGPDAVQDQDRRWAEALAPLAPAWPVHFATTGSSGRGRVWTIT